MKQSKKWHGPKCNETETKRSEADTKCDDRTKSSKTDIAIWQHKQKVMKRNKKY